MNTAITIALGFLFMMLYMSLSATFQAFAERQLGIWLYLAGFSAGITVIIINFIPRLFS